MLISIKYNFVFLCNTKCASNSIESMLEPHSDIIFSGLPVLRHTNYRQYSQHIRPYLIENAGVDNIETICLVREPLSWLSSWYRFRSRHDLRNKKHPSHQNSTSGIQFSEFIKAYMLSDPPSYANVGSQYDFVKDSMNAVGVDKIFPYENIGGFVRYMGSKVGKKLKLNNMNVSPKTNYRSNIAQWVTHSSQKAIYKYVFKKKYNLSKVELELSEENFCSLREFISSDFELYESISSVHMI
jgi:hypothetical protein